jgi:hypothetical protein
MLMRNISIGEAFPIKEKVEQRIFNYKSHCFFSRNTIVDNYTNFIIDSS